MEFVILPLETATIPEIFRHLGGSLSGGVFHIQIEKNRRLEFSAYDEFYPGCIGFGNAVTKQFLSQLISEGLLKKLGGDPSGPLTQLPRSQNRDRGHPEFFPT